MITAVVAYFYLIIYGSMQNDPWVTETICGTIDVNMEWTGQESLGLK